MNKKILFLVFWGLAMHAFAQQSPFNTGNNTFNYQSPQLGITGMIGEAYLGQISTLSASGRSVFIGFPYDLIYTQDVFNGGLFASKGYYSDFVKLQWELYSTDLVTQIKIYRKKLSEGDDLFRLVGTLSSDESTWQDVYAEPGQMYAYKVIADGVWDTEIMGLNRIDGVGFRVTSATVTGRVTYKGGNIVEGVKVFAEPEISGKEGEYCYHFPESIPGNYGLVNPHSPADLSNGASVQAWVKPTWFNNKEYNPVFSLGTSLSFGFKQNTDSTWLYVTMGSMEMGSEQITDSIMQNYMQITLSWFADGDSVKLYLNGMLVLSENFPGKEVGQSNWFIGGASKGNTMLYFSGYMDEIKLWKKPLNAKDVYRTFDAYENPNNSNLVGYWKMNEGGGRNFYDISRLNSNFNENHASIVSANDNYDARFSTYVPSASRLGYKAVSDENGNYVIAGISYSSGGSYFRVVPSMGIHQFDPTNKLLYISQESSVFNNIDFTDISSFRVTGTVMYAGTRYPVRDVFLKVDGVIVSDEKKQPVRTNGQGEFEIDVPIGEHYISLEKNGHVFESAYWPALDEYGNATYFDFQDDVYGINFSDTTKLTLVGKIVGGPVEGQKGTGSLTNPTTNNIGQVKVTLTTERGVDLWNNDPTVSFTTNAANGTYRIELLPEKFILLGAPATINPGIAFNRASDGLPIDMSNKFNLQYTVDSVFRDTVVSGETQKIFEKVDTVLVYNHNRDWIWRSSPEMVITNKNDSAYWGEKTYNYKVNRDSSIIIPLVQRESDESYTYLLGHPVFLQLNTYDLKIEVVEPYTNADNNEVSTVPVTDGTVVIENQFANTNKQDAIKLNEKGIATHTFIGGIPLEADPYTKNINFKLKVGDNYIPGAEITEACYVLGGKLAGGLNFVTGPDEIDFILRDPPGSESYSYFQKGFTVSKTTTSSSVNGFGGDIDILYMMGIEYVTDAGTPFFSIETKIETDNSIGLSTSNDFKWNEDNTYTTSKTYQFNFSTSSDPLFVGDMGDVFFGHGTNIYYGAASNVRILRDEFGNYTVGNKKALIVGKKETTDFVYTQNHIEKYLIPNLEKLRNQLFDSVVYISHFLPSDPKFGLSNTDPVFGNQTVDTTATAILGPSFDFIPKDETPSDSIRNEVEEYNLLINYWKKILAKNELLKLTATEGFDDHNDFTNLSFDAGSSIESSVTYETTDESSSSFEWSVDAGVAAEVGFTLNKFGFKLKAKERYHHAGGESSTNSETSSETIGFVLKDGDIGDYFSLDIKKDQVFGSPVFILRGGQSVCPAEPGSSTRFLEPNLKPVLLSEIDEYVDNLIGDLSWDEKIDLVDGSPSTFDQMINAHKTEADNDYKAFYKDLYMPGIEISSGSMQRESPEITADRLFISNVPEGRKAEFSIFLSNTSDVDMNAWYGLFVDPASNPDGAVVKVDGTSVVNGITILVPAGKTITKTLTVEKGSSEVNLYEGLDIIMHSLCQFDPTDDVPDISDTLTISVEFSKSCTEIAITSPLDQWVVNNSFKKESGRYEMPVQFSKYDLNHGKLTSFTFQYKFSEGNQWNTIQTFVDGMSGEDTTDIAGNPVTTFIWDMTDLQNRNYDLRAITYCSDGSIYESDVVSGVYDSKPPKVFGSPRPADGILSPNSEILLPFDEDIQAGIFGKANISLTGIQNGTDLRDYDYVLHDASLHFDGVSQNMTVLQIINLNYTPFTIEFWAKRERTGVQECLISHGDVNNGGLWVGFNADDQFVMKLNGETLSSTATFTNIGVYNHYAMVFDNGGNDGLNEMRMIIAKGDETFTPSKKINVNYFGSASLLVANDGTNGFKGNMHNLRMWNQASTMSEVTARRYTMLNGYEKGLIGAWAMDEAFGDLAEDKAFSRHGEVNATWSIFKQGSALTLNGGYARFNTAQLEMTNTSDFTIEFWFKTAKPSTDEYLFSNGKADGSDSSPLKWAVVAASDGTIKILNDGNSFMTDATSYFDNNWHHLALVVNRRGNMTVYLDGIGKISESATKVTGMGGAYIALGARYYLENASESAADMFFNGVLDEVRVWNAARTQVNIQELMNHSLYGSEKGLKAYFPFEDVTVTDPSVNNQTLENMTMDDNAIAGDCELFDGSAFSLETAAIKLARPLGSIPFDYSINGNQILISPNIDASRIENTVLNISVDGAYDLYGNRMESTVSWTAFVDKNQLVWQKQEVSLECSPDNPPVFTLTIENKGGTTEYWEIDNIPVWLTANMTMGTLSPLSSQDIVFTVNPAINVGRYNHDIYVNGNLDYNERCKINLSVIDEEPDWTFDPNDYETSMSVIGKLSIAGELSMDVNDVVAAFIDESCRGSAHVQYIRDRDLYLVNLTIHGNMNETGTVTFNVWDAGTGNLYTSVTPSFAFNANGIMGEPSDPVDISTTNDVGKEIPIKAGWNWMSFNLTSDQLNNTNSLLAGIQSATNDEIKSKILFDTYVEGAGWDGTLSDNGYVVTQSYKLKNSYADTLKVSGVPVSTASYPVQIEKGWNWIGYTPQHKMPVESALSYYEPEHRDLIKNQVQFSMFDQDLGWIGSLTYMKPNEGYMYHSENDASGSFVYPQETLFKGVRIPETYGSSDVSLNRYEFNMSAFAIATGGVEVTKETELRALNNDGNIVGIVKPVNVLDNWLFPITIAGKAEEGEVSFRLINGSADVLTALETLNYQPDAIVGSVRNPLRLTFGDHSDMPVMVSPNPFNDKIRIWNIPDDLAGAAIYDMQGRLIRQWGNIPTDQLVWDGKSSDGSIVEGGVYVLQLRGNTEIETVMIVKNK
ncbi:LamG-like jellyroll fold domain-containing protein [Saccharicrinis sp. FJH62]|uniref:LamG-like jellyroll fold domain-containing protein n=1 Tax=Saccharicrinis sp. FJH62 TaxID=3344657 RepID=UPI0035D47EE2